MWKVVCGENISEKENILEGIPVLAIKSEETEREIRKVRFILQEHKEVVNSPIVQNILVACQKLTKLLLGLTGTFGFQICSTNIG